MIEASKYFDRASVKIEKIPAGMSFPDDVQEPDLVQREREAAYYKGVMEAEATRRADEALRGLRIPRRHRPAYRATRAIRAIRASSKIRGCG